MKLSGVIFDFDGTLANTIPVCCAAFRAAARNHTERELSDADIIALFGPSEEGIIRGLTGGDWEDCYATFLSAYESEHTLCPEPFPDVRHMLDALRAAGVPMAIVTGKGQRSADISLRLLGITHYFDAIEACSPEGGIMPEAIARVLARWGLFAAEVAYVGDAASDMDDTRTGGTIPLAACWAATTNVAAMERARPHAVFTSVAALQAWLSQHIDG